MTWTIGKFCEIVATGGLRYGGSVISWGRTRKRQGLLKAQGLKPHPDSFHLLWLAADIVFDDAEGADGAERYYERQGLQVVRKSPDTLHVEPAI